jgi:hypothetical protein
MNAAPAVARLYWCFYSEASCAVTLYTHLRFAQYQPLVHFLFSNYALGVLLGNVPVANVM